MVDLRIQSTMNLSKLPKVATRALVDDGDHCTDDEVHYSDGNNSPRSPRTGHSFASTVLRGTSTVINQATFVRVVSQPGAADRELHELFEFCKPRQKMHSNTSVLLKLTPKQHDAMYALAGCADVGNVASKVSAAAREAMGDLYGIDKQRFSTWFKNRRLRNSNRKGASPRSSSPRSRSQPSSPMGSMAHSSVLSQPPTPQHGSRLARGQSLSSEYKATKLSPTSPLTAGTDFSQTTAAAGHVFPASLDRMSGGKSVEPWSMGRAQMELPGLGVPHSGASYPLSAVVPSSSQGMAVDGSGDEVTHPSSCPADPPDSGPLLSPMGELLGTSGRLSFFGSGTSADLGLGTMGYGNVPDNLSSPGTVLGLPGLHVGAFGEPGSLPGMSSNSLDPYTSPGISPLTHLCVPQDQLMRCQPTAPLFTPAGVPTLPTAPMPTGSGTQQMRDAFDSWGIDSGAPAVGCAVQANELNPLEAEAILETLGRGDL